MWLCDSNDKLLHFSSTWGAQSPKSIILPDDTAYAIFGIQQQTTWNNDSCFTCWNLGKDNCATYGLIDSQIDRIEFEIPHPLRSSGTTKDEIRFNSLVGEWELVTRVSDDLSVLDSETTTTLHNTTKQALTSFSGMTRLYMLESGTHPTITCDVPTSTASAVSVMSLSEGEDEAVGTYNMTTFAVNSKDYDNGIYVYDSEGNEYIPLRIGAKNISINDVLNNFSSTHVEGALSELASKVNNIDLSNVTFNDIAGNVPISKLPMEDIRNNIGSNLEVTMISKLKNKTMFIKNYVIIYI